MKDIDELSKNGGSGSQSSVMHKLRGGQDRNILHREDPLYMAENATQQVW
jgi:hypothetical protein